MAQSKNPNGSDMDHKEGVAKISGMLTTLNQLRASIDEFFCLERIIQGDDVTNKVKNKLENIKSTIELLDKLAAEAEVPLIEAQKLGLARKWDLEKLLKSELPHDDAAKADDRPKDPAPVLDPSAVRAQVAELLRKNAERTLSYLSTTTVHRIKRSCENENEDTAAKKVKTELGRVEEGTAKSVQHYHRLENLVNEWLASHKFADVEVHVSRLGGGDGEGTPSPVGSVACVKVSVVRVLNAVADIQYDPISDSMAFNRLAVFGWKEEKNIWQDSDHFLFQRITQLATETLDRFAAMDGKEALICFLDWLASHRNLFTATCRGCAKHLYFDSPQFKYLPPTVRSWRGMRRGLGGPRRTSGGGSSADSETAKAGGERLVEGGGTVEEVGVPFHPQCL